MGIPDLRNSPLAPFKSKAPKRILEESGAQEAMEYSAADGKLAHSTTIGCIKNVK
jgi:hypothetical protein